MKPIFITKLNKNYCSNENFDNISKKLNDSLSKDYYVLVINVYQDEDIAFEMHNAIDLDDKSFEELKEMVTQLINK